MNKKIWLLVFLVFFAGIFMFYNARAFDWSDGAVYDYWALNESSGTVAIDNLLRFNLTNNGTTINQPGKIGTSYYFDGSNSDVYNDTFNGVPINTAGSVSLWFNGSTTQCVDNCRVLELWGADNDRFGFIIDAYDTDKMNVYMRKGGTTVVNNYTGASVQDDLWHHYVLTWNNTMVTIWQDGLNFANVTNNASMNFGSSIRLDFGALNPAIGSGYNAKGQLDEVGFWNRSLISSEIAELYNGGNGLSYNPTTPDITIPAIVHDSPINGSWYNFAPFLNGTCTDDIAVSSIWTNLTEYSTVDTISPYNFTNTTALTSGIYTVKVSCNDTSNNNATAVFYFNYDSILPTPAINSPVNLTNLTDNTPDVRITFTDNIGASINYTFYINGTMNKTGSVLNSTATNITMDTLNDGWWRILVQATDNASNSINSSKYWYLIDTTSPTVNLSSPVDTYNSSSTSITFIGNASDNIALKNITLYSNVTGTWVSNGSNTSVLNNTATSFARVYPEGYYKWGLYVCDWTDYCTFSANRTLKIDTVNLISPASGAIVYTTYQTFSFSLNTSGNTDVYNCSVYVDSVLMGSNITTQTTNISTIYVPLIGYGSHVWYISCTNSTQPTVTSQTLSYTSGDSPPSTGGSGTTPSPSTCSGIQSINFTVADLWSKKADTVAIVTFTNNVANLEDVNITAIKMFALDYGTDYNLTYEIVRSDKGNYRIIFHTINLNALEGYYDIKLFSIDCAGHAQTSTVRIRFIHGAISSGITGGVIGTFGSLTSVQKIALILGIGFILALFMMVILLGTSKSKKGD